MFQYFLRTGRCGSARAWRGVLYGSAVVFGLSAPASAAVLGSHVPLDFTAGSGRFGFGTTNFSFSDISGGGFTFDSVGVATTSEGAVSSLGFPFFSTPQPSTFFDPFRNNGTVFGPNGGVEFTNFPDLTTIAGSATPFFIGLADTTAAETYYGYGEFYGTELVSYAFESRPGVSLQPGATINGSIPGVSPVPLPGSLALFGGARLVLARSGIVGARRERLPAA